MGFLDPKYSLDQVLAKISLFQGTTYERLDGQKKNPLYLMYLCPQVRSLFPLA